MKKEKTITFRHWRKVESLHPADIERMKEVLIEECLSRGYVPFVPLRVERKLGDPWNMFDRVSTECAYAGKVQARKIGVQERPTTLQYLSSPHIT